jgi:hypothetical protein
VISQRDATYTNLSRAYAFEWRHRVSELCFPPGVTEEGNCYLKQDTRTLREIAREYGATYVIVEADHKQLDFPVVFANSGFRIHRIEL